MKFVSTMLSGQRRLKCTAPFDTEFIQKLERGDDNTIHFEYELRDFQTGFPVDVSRASFAIKPTSDNMFVWATVYINGECFPIRKFLNDWGDFECEVEMNEQESKKLMLFLLNTASHGDTRTTLTS